MKKRKTIKYKSDSPMNYQIGGQILPFLNKYTNLNNQWDTFWKGGNYFNEDPDPNYDPLKAVSNGYTSDRMLNEYVFKSTNAANKYTNSLINYNTQKGLYDNAYKGAWGDDAHNFYYNNTLGNKYTPSQLTSFADREKEWGGNSGGAGRPEGFEEWYNGRKAYSNTAGQQYDADRKVITGFPDVKKQALDIQKEASGVMSEGLSGIFTGMNYLNAYKPEKPITLQEGFQGVQTGQMGIQVPQNNQINTTGYTQGSPTVNNKINIIPGSEGTMEGVHPDQRLVAIGRKGADNGVIKIVDKTTPRFKFKSDSFLELPINKVEEQPEIQYAQFGSAIQDLYQQLPNINNNYLSTIAGDSQYGPSVSTPEFNNRMIQGYNNAQQANIPSRQYTANELMQGAASNQNIINPNSNGIYPIQAGYSEPVVNNQSLVFNVKGDRTYEYKQDGDVFYTRKKGSNSWIDMKSKLSLEDYNQAMDNITKGKVSQATTPSGAAKTSRAKIISANNVVNEFNAESDIYIPAAVAQTVAAVKEENKKASAVSNNKSTKKANNKVNVNLGSLSEWLPTFTNPNTGENYTSDDYSKYIPKQSLTTTLTKTYLKNRKKWNEDTPSLFNTPVNKKLPKLLNQLSLYKYGGEIPKYQLGGEVNNDYAYPIHPITEEFTEIQTELGEVVSLPDSTIVDVKANELHKTMHKDDVTDILPAKSHVFSNDPKMKLNLDSSIGGVKIKDMKLGKSVFEYKENQVTVGPKDVMLSEIWGKKKELTPAELVNNVKKKFELRDNKNNFLTQRANEENKEQRGIYLDVIKAFSEFKKPKKRTGIPKAQYGMQLPSMNVGLPNIYNQPTNNAIDGMMGYNTKSLDPYINMDNNMKSMYNISSVVNPKLYQDGGDIPHAPLGMLIGAAAASLLGEGLGYLFGNSAKKKQEEENKKYLAQYNTSVQNYKDSVNRQGTLEVGTSLASYMAGLNVPRQLYDDQSEQLALNNDHFRTRNAQLQAQKYTQLNDLGGAGSLARYTNPNNIGQYLAASQQGYNQNVSGINAQIGSLADQKVQRITDLLSQRNAGYNASENAYNNQLYNVNVQGITGVGQAASTHEANIGQVNYQTDLERMSFERQLKSDAQAAYDRKKSTVKGLVGDIGSGVASISNYMDWSKLNGLNKIQPTTSNYNSGVSGGAWGTLASNIGNYFPNNGNNTGSISNINAPIPGPTYNTILPNSSVNRTNNWMTPQFNLPPGAIDLQNGYAQLPDGSIIKIR